MNLDPFHSQQRTSLWRWGPLVALLLTGGDLLAVEVPGTQGRLLVGGWLDGLAVVPTEDSPHQKPQGLADVSLDADLGGAFSAHLNLRGAVGGPFRGAEAGLFNFVHAFQNLSPSLSALEAYVELRLRDADLRLGVQRFTWGKLDGIAPTDVVSPRSYHDPFVEDFEEAKLGLPALTGSYYPPDIASLDLSELRVTVSYLPFAGAPRLPLVRERWFPPTTDFGDFVVSGDLLSSVGLPPEDLVIPVTVQTRNSAPPKTLAAGGIALRIGGSWKRSDWEVYHYTGAVTAPNLLLDIELILNSLNPLALEALTVLRQKHDVMHMTGAAWSQVLGPATVRAEAAFFVGQAYLRDPQVLIRETIDSLTEEELRRIRDTLLESGRARLAPLDIVVTRDSVEWGVGLDYQWRGYFLLGQVNQIALFESAPRLLVGNPGTQLTFLVRRSFMRDRLEVEVRTLYAIERHSWVVFPRLSYLVLDDLRLRLGYLSISGPSDSLYGQFDKNDQLVLQVRYSF
jgi:hypothetical protein